MADVYDKTKRSQIMASIKGKNTSPERLLTAIVRGLGFECEQYRKDLPGSPDIVLPCERVAIFINGCFWHGHKNCPRAALPKTNKEFWKNKIEKNKRRDERQKRLLRQAGWHVATIWTCDRITQKLVESKLRRLQRLKLKARA